MKRLFNKGQKLPYFESMKRHNDWEFRFKLTIIIVHVADTVYKNCNRRQNLIIETVIASKSFYVENVQKWQKADNFTNLTEHSWFYLTHI